MSNDENRGLSQWLVSESALLRLADASATVQTDVNGELRPPPEDVSCVTERFDDLGEIGRGGMNTVRRVFDRYLLRDNALKVLDPRAERDEDRARRFLAEARVTGQLEHPNIVPVHELGMDDEGVCYFSMKLVQGQTLEERIQSVGDSRLDPEPLAALLEIFVKVCEAVSFAHSKGVVHRDLKPANVMVGAYGQVYLMDWGIARVLSEDMRLRAGGEALALNETPDGAIVGTPRYMAPEQAEGRPDLIDERTDVFALGATLYHILTGRPPYLASSKFMVLLQAAEADLAPPEAVIPEGVPPGLSRIAMRSMAPDKADRYTSVVELKRDVEAFLCGAWNLPTRDYRAGTRIITRGDEGDEAYIIVSGHCQVVRDLGGQRHVVRRLGPGEVFGELAIVTDKPRNAHVDAETDVRLNVVSRDTLSEAMGLDSWVGRFVRALAERFREIDGQLQEREVRAYRASREPGGPLGDQGEE